MKLYYVRHGEADWNVEKRLMGRADRPLTEKGELQARELAEKIKDIKVDIIIASPLKRAYRTAEIINEKLHKELIIDQRLLEREYGIYEGKFSNEFPYDDFWCYSKNISAEGAEDMKTFFDRAREFINELKENNQYESILIVAHNGLGRAVKHYFQEMTDDEIINWDMPNGEAVEYEL